LSDAFQDKERSNFTAIHSQIAVYINHSCTQEVNYCLSRCKAFIDGRDEEALPDYSMEDRITWAGSKRSVAHPHIEYHDFYGSKGLYIEREDYMDRFQARIVAGHEETAYPLWDEVKSHTRTEMLRLRDTVFGKEFVQRQMREAAYHTTTRKCPNCSIAYTKEAGCAAVRCGFMDYHQVPQEHRGDKVFHQAPGKNGKVHGCGHLFDWNVAITVTEDEVLDFLRVEMLPDVQSSSSLPTLWNLAARWTRPERAENLHGIFNRWETEMEDPVDHFGDGYRSGALRRRSGLISQHPRYYDDEPSLFEPILTQLARPFAAVAGTFAWVVGLPAEQSDDNFETRSVLSL